MIFDLFHYSFKFKEENIKLKMLSQDRVANEKMILNLLKMNLSLGQYLCVQA